MTALEMRTIAPAHERFAGLMASVANWEMIQATRIKVQHPIKACERQGVAPPPWTESVLSMLALEERGAEKQLLREWRNHPLNEWGVSIFGVGEKSLAIVVGHLKGDPYIAYPQRWQGTRGNARVVSEDPFVRTVSQLWAYCGLDPERRRVEGMSQDDLLALGKPMLKARLRLIAEAMLKGGNREGYDSARARYAERIHDRPCPPCHAKAGDPWRDGHKHAAALRLVGKEFLRDLWLESRSLHDSGLL